MVFYKEVVMKKVVIILGVLVLALSLACPAFASIGQFVGKWKNTDANTRGITTLEIGASGTALSVQAWGKCSPQDCDWGMVPGYAYGLNVSSNLGATASVVTALYKTNFSETILVIRSGGAHLRADSFTRFTDNSKRSNYTATYLFTKFTAAPVLTAPVQVSPVNGTVFNNFPRTTKLEWKPVPGAASYTVEIDCMHCCQSGKWCTDIGKQYKVVPNLKASSYTFNFVGAQPGKWRVWAVGANGQPGPKSAWWEFRYTR